MAGRADSIGIPVIDREQRVVRRGQCCREPRRGGVARVAGCRPPGRGVIRIGGAGVIGHMAAGAKCWRADEYVVNVAQRACYAGVEAGKWEWGVVVIESGIEPVSRRVAGVARGREAGDCVCRVGGAVVVGLVAAVAKRRQRAVVAGRRRVALDALHGRVEARKRERRRAVIKG